ncbi:hypothetical protein BU17DRAFT_53445 [Hysterangium stoloniferum]|nr:hypothetical protein BU17DRAFT_53445 [Hysterangium stoloniferum]
MVSHNSSTPSLISSIGTISSSGELPIASPLPPPPIPAKGKERVFQRTSYTLSHAPSRCSQGSYYGYTTYLDSAWNNPIVFKCLLDHMSWREFHAVSRVSRTFRNIFKSQELKDITLARFVPGYTKESREGTAEDVRVSLQDLEALMVSSSYPLHHYPRHAVNVLSADNNIVPYLTAISHRLVRFAQAHSRFVLLLRSQAPRWQSNFDTEEFVHKSTSAVSLRELTFPAPLSYIDSHNTGEATSPSLSASSSTTSKRRVSQSRKNIGESSSLPPSPRTSKKLFSVFGAKERVPLPLPQPSPPSMKYYSSIGRRRFPAAEPSYTSHSRFISESLPPPRYPFTSAGANSPSSSQGSLPRSASLLSPRMQPSAHDLINACSRTRAPILRVFVPCSSLNDDDVIAEAEQQLISIGLWKHLRTGDAVVNLGYVPKDSSIVCGWLIYSNDALHPFFPPNPLPIDDFKALESPLYFSHLVPPQSNLRCAFPLPRVRMRMELCRLSSNIPSPHSPNGRVRVVRHAWLGKIHVREDDTEALGFGESWSGDWVLEAEGTKEGTSTLMDAMERNGQVREWEIVREKSGPHKLWLKCVIFT